MFFPIYVYQLLKVQSGFFFVFRTDKIYMNLLQHYFSENLWKKISNGGVRRGMRGVPSNWTVVDRGDRGVKNLLFFADVINE